MAFLRFSGHWIKLRLGALLDHPGCVENLAVIGSGVLARNEVKS